MKKLKKIDMHVHCIEERGIPKLSGHFYPTVHELRKIYDEIGVEKGFDFNQHPLWFGGRTAG